MKTINKNKRERTPPLDSKNTTFFSIPYALINSSEYSDMPVEAAVLYGLLRDRNKLSEKNKWTDEIGTFLHFTVNTAGEALGITEVPCEVIECSRDEAVILAVDSNAQRQKLLPSERAFAYRMKLQALNSQGKRTDLDSCPSGTKLNSGYNLAAESGESRRKIYRLIRLTELIPELRDAVDTGRIALSAGVELSYLPVETQEQIEGLHGDGMPYPTYSQANQLKKMAASCELSAVLNYAVNCDWLKKNPAKNCSIGEKNAQERLVWTAAEYARFRAAAAAEPQYFYAFEMLYLTGMRKGELYGLTLGDIDFEKKTVRINKSLQYLNGKPVVTSPKTKMSVRTVRLNDKLLDELQEYIAMMPGMASTDRLFPITNGQLQGALKRLVRKAGLDYISLHCFRHSHITNLISAGFSPADIAKRVGHESIFITLHYSHAFKNVDEEMTKRLDEGMGGKYKGEPDSSNSPRLSPQTSAAIV